MQENKQEKSPIKQKILQYLDFKGISQYKFYQDTGVTRGVLAQNNGISEENIARFLDYYKDVSPEWLLTGNGKMLKSVNVISTPIPEPSKNRKLIPLYDDVATIGGGNTVSASVDGCIPASEWVDAGDFFHDATAAIRHYGDSMIEYPSGCVLVLKKVEDLRLIIWGRNYVVETSEFRITKRLQSGEGDTIVAYSSNTDTYPDGRHIHEPKTIPMDSIRSIWLVLGYVVKEYSSGAVFIKK